MLINLLEEQTHMVRVRCTEESMEHMLFLGRHQMLNTMEKVFGAIEERNNQWDL